MKKVLSLLLVVLVLIGNVALVSCDYEIVIQKKTTQRETTREATREDIFCELERDWGNDGTTVICTFKLQANEKIEGLVIQLTLETEDGKVIVSDSLDIGKVAPGNQYSWQLYLSQEELQAFDGYRVEIVEGYVIIE